MFLAGMTSTASCSDLHRKPPRPRKSRYSLSHQHHPVPAVEHGPAQPLRPVPAPPPYHHHHPSASFSSLHLSSPPPQYAPPYAPSTTPVVPPRPPVHKKHRSLDKWKSCTNLSGMVDATNSTMAGLERQMRDCVSSSVDLYESLYGSVMKRLDDVITAMDEGLFSEKEKNDMVLSYPVQTQTSPNGYGTPTPEKPEKSSYFAKVYLYSNSRLPPHLPPLRTTPEILTLLHLAAQSSLIVYRKPPPIHPAAPNPNYIHSDWRQGTKAMMIKSHAQDDQHTIVLAIRGTQSFRDWAVNWKTEPTSPAGFLDNSYNASHGGFLAVAKKMIAPVAARLRSLLAEKEKRRCKRTPYSLLITGHSAGGAVASLLYCHMLALSVSSELTYLKGYFKQIHCVTFGAPPVTLYPLFPSKSDLQRKSLFLSLINEGDPVAKADKNYLASLLNLYASPAPDSSLLLGSNNASNNSSSGKTSWLHPHRRRESRYSRPSQPAVWQVPPNPLSIAGTVTVLRKKSTGAKGGFLYPTADPAATGEEGIEACLATDAVLRQVVFGDPVMHMMAVYMRRVEELVRRGS